MEAWPRSSWTTRTSAPRPSMWVAQEWRRTWGLTLSARPTRPAYFLTTPKTPDPGQPPATGVEEDRLGVAAAAPLLRLEQRPALAREPLGQGGAGEPAERDDALLVPLARAPGAAAGRSPSTAPATSPRLRPTTSLTRAPVP